MLKKLFNDNLNNKIRLIREGIAYTIDETECFIAGYSKFLNSKKQNIVILSEDNFSFIIQFFASIFSKKNIYIIPDKTRLKSLNFDYDILEPFNPKEHITIPIKENFDNFYPEKIIIHFCTSGSGGSPKVIKKTLKNLIAEADGIKNEFKLNTDSNTIVKSSTTLRHFFGMIFHLMLPLICGYSIDTDMVNFPEDLNKKDLIFISTPTFLKMMKKLDLTFAIPPKLIFSAGSKLEENVFKFLQKNSSVTEIYGSTETGVIAYKTAFEDAFNIFKEVFVKSNGVKTLVKSKYIYNAQVEIDDEVQVDVHSLILKCRTDRILKIYEKRISADELESSLNANEFVKACYIFKHKEKISCLCALSDAGTDFVLKESVPQLVKHLKQYMKNVSDVIPQKWKFIDEIPLTKTGKINVNLIQHLFNLNLSLPIILDRGVSERVVLYKILFYRQCNFFKGHFPEFKLLPGVVQLYLAKMFANLHFQLQLGAGQWKKIKFSNIIRPDSVVFLKLEKTAKHVAYEYYSDEEKYSSGLFLCENIFQEAK